MKNLLSLPVLFLMFATLWLSSCVTKGKYIASQDWVHKLEADSAKLTGKLTDCNSSLNKCDKDLSEASSKLASTSDQLAGCQVQAKNLQQDKDDLTQKNTALKNELDELSSSTKNKISEQAKKLKDLEDLIQSQRDVMNKVRREIADALVGFKPDELTVKIKNGNVYVSLQEKLLFKSGSAVVDPLGKKALKTLATVLNANKEININIEGHTDTVPIHTEKFEDNWALSVGRATSIVRILTKDYEIDPHRITASGRGEFHPVQSNDTPVGKTANRRTEIILSPNLSELYKLLGQE